MRVEHVGVWAADLERLREFYAAYLGATAGAKYTNPAKGFESYFLTLPGGGARLELMRVPGLAGASGGRRVGLVHVAIALGSEAAVPDERGIAGDPRPAADCGRRLEGCGIPDE